MRSSRRHLSLSMVRWTAASGHWRRYSLASMRATLAGAWAVARQDRVRRPLERCAVRELDPWSGVSTHQPQECRPMTRRVIGCSRRLHRRLGSPIGKSVMCVAGSPLAGVLLAAADSGVGGSPLPRSHPSGRHHPTRPHTIVPAEGLADLSIFGTLPSPSDGVGLPPLNAGTERKVRLEAGYYALKTMASTSPTMVETAMRSNLRIYRLAPALRRYGNRSPRTADITPRPHSTDCLRCPGGLVDLRLELSVRRSIWPGSACSSRPRARLARVLDRSLLDPSSEHVQVITGGYALAMTPLAVKLHRRDCSERRRDRRRHPLTVVTWAISWTPPS